MSIGADAKHEFGADGLCALCHNKECGDAFWAMFGASPGTSGLRFRPGKPPEFLGADHAPTHQRLGGLKCLCGSPSCPNPASEGDP